MSLVEFEPMDEELEEALMSIKNEAGVNGTLTNISRPWSDEVNELERVGCIENVDRYYDMTACFNLTYKGVKYFDRKEKWKKEQTKKKATTIAERVVDKGTDLAAAVIQKSLGM